MPLVAVRRKTQRPALHGVPHQPLHLFNLLGRGGSLHGLLAHDVLAHRDVAHQPAHIDADFPFQGVQIIAEGVPAPGNSLLQNAAGNGLDPDEAFHQRVVVGGLSGCERKAAITHDDGGNAMLGLGGSIGVPENLRVHVGVVVDEARSQGKTLGVNCSMGAVPNPADLDDSPTLDRDVSSIGRQTAAVVDASPLDQQVTRHGFYLLCWISTYSACLPSGRNIGKQIDGVKAFRPAWLTPNLLLRVGPLISNPAASYSPARRPCSTIGAGELNDRASSFTDRRQQAVACISELRVQGQHVTETLRPHEF